MGTEVYIALGTNLGNKLNNLKQSIILLNNNNIDIKNISKIYETPPMYETNQPQFLNMVVHASTDLAPEDLLETLKNIEVQVGRTKTYTNGPRVVDLDILYYGNIVLDSPHLYIPHLRIAERQFVLQPMCDLSPNYTDPRTNKTIKQMANAIPTDPQMAVYTQTL